MIRLLLLLLLSSCRGPAIFNVLELDNPEEGGGSNLEMITEESPPLYIIITDNSSETYECSNYSEWKKEIAEEENEK